MANPDCNGKCIPSSTQMEMPQEVQKILAWDYSGSTSNMSTYHTLAKKYLQQFANSCDFSESNKNKPIYLKWSGKCDETELKALLDISKDRSGFGGTNPSTIINWIKENIPTEKLIELCLITDGEIDNYELRKCSELNKKGVNYSSIDFIIINTRPINMSVGASFFRGAQLRIFHNDQLTRTIDTSKPFDYDSITLSNFDSTWDSLSNFIQAKFMGSDLDSLEEADKLNALKRRLLNEISKQSNSSSDAKNFVPEFPSKKQSEILKVLKSCQFYKTLTTPVVKDLRSSIDGAISGLVNHIHNKHKSFDFVNLKLNYKQDKIGYVENEPEPELDNLDDYETCNFYDAVTLEDESNVPVLLLPVTDLIFKYWIEGNYSKFRTIMDCPLMAQIDDCIGHVYTFETFKSICSSDSGITTNPMTNQPVFGGLIFTTDADKWNDFVLMKTFFRGKKVKTCLDIWYFVIWSFAKNKPWIEPGVADLFKSYAIQRLTKAKVNLAFSTLPLDPKEIVPLPIACFYCTEGSSLLFGEKSSLYLEERLRMYWSVADKMLEILKYFNYDQVDEQFVKNRAKVFEVMHQLKRIPQEIEKKYFLLEKAFESVGPFLTYKLKDQNYIQFLLLLQFHHKNSLIPFEFMSNNNAFDFRKFILVSYDYENTVDVPICPQTLRPYFAVVESNSNEKNVFEPYYKQVLGCLTEKTLKVNGEVDGEIPVLKLDQRKLVSLRKLYIDLTYKLKRFPDFDEFSNFVHKCVKVSGNKIRLFSPNILKDVNEIFISHSKLNISVDEFINKTQSSVKISSRIKMEERMKDQNFGEFIQLAKGMLIQH